MLTDVEIKEKALFFLARREHSASELQRKLLQRGACPNRLPTIIASLQADNLQSDARFTESYTRSRIAKGFGPIAIYYALRQQHNISDSCIADYLYPPEAPFWGEQIARVIAKKFSTTVVVEAHIPFLRSRGFSATQIYALIRERQED